MGREKKFYYLDSDTEKKNPQIWYAEHQPGYHKAYAQRRKLQDPAWAIMKREYHRQYRELQKQQKIEEEIKEMKKIKIKFPTTMIKAVSEPTTLSWG